MKYRHHGVSVYELQLYTIKIWVPVLIWLDTFTTRAAAWALMLRTGVPHSPTSHL